MVALLALAGCSSSQLERLSPVARTVVTAVDNARATVTVTDAALTDDQAAELREGWAPEAGVAVGEPVSIASADPIPEAGIRISRSYATPLPDGQTATLAYFDEDLGTWHAVPSTLSEDRRTISAVVHHLSLWTDIKGFFAAAVDTVQDKAADVAEWAYYQVGKVFDTRVDPPACTGSPSWVDDTTFIETQRNNSLLFCTGADPKQPQLVVVKARINRGFAFHAFVKVPTSWSYNSTFGEKSLEDAIADAGHISDTFAEALSEFAPAGRVVVGAGQEFSFGATEQALREVDDSIALEMKAPSVVSFLISTLGRLVGTELDTMAEGYIAAVIAITGCYSDVKAAHDASSWTRALITCTSRLDKAIAGKLATFLTKRGKDPVKAGNLSGKVIGRAGIYLALIGPVFNGMNYLAEGATPQSARTVSIFPKVNASPASSAPATSADLVAFVQAGQQAAVSDYDEGAWAEGDQWYPLMGGVAFSTPSKNIRCDIVDKNAICHILAYSFAPPQPKDCGNIAYLPDYVWLTRGEGVAQGVCTGGILIHDGSNVLPYGSTLSTGSIACRSESALLACADLTTGQGFAMSRELFRIYGRAN